VGTHDTAEKSELRRALRRQRAALNPVKAVAHSAAIMAQLSRLSDFAAARRVFIFVSAAGEPDTRPLIADLLAAGRVVCVPRCRAGGVMEAVDVPSLDALVPAKMGLLEPPEHYPATDVKAIDFTVIPALACDANGGRLGQGGGYYDRFLAQYAGPRAAVVFEAFILPTVPMAAHDRRVARIITERRVIVPEGV
jgi:5-formyltetrahydrofolate cyclo-ligase